MNPLQYAEQICYSSKEVLHFTYDMAKKYAGKPGTCYVECGCAAGAQVIAMLAANSGNRVYAFDSWKGIPLPSNKDNQMPGIRFLTEAEQQALPNPGEQVLESSGATVVPFDDFKNHVVTAFYGMGIVECFEKLAFELLPVEGWFEETLPEMAPQIEPISLLRLDGDLYNSTYVCLKYLYPKLIIGGLCIIDDYALPGCRQAVFDYFFDNRDELNSFDMEFIEDKNSKVAYWIKK